MRFDPATQAVLATVPPAAAELIGRMAARIATDWSTPRRFRERVFELNGIAAGDDEQAAVCLLYGAFMDLIARNALLPPDTLEKLARIRQADMHDLIQQQAARDPVRLDQITRREVAAGRLAAQNGAAPDSEPGSEPM